MINYRSVNDLSAAVAESCANGINIFFDNTGGWIADSIFPHLAQSARIIQCGTAATRSWIPHPGGPRREREMLVKRLSWQGFVVFDHADSFPQAFDDLKALYRSEKLQSREHLLDSLDDAPGAIDWDKLAEFISHVKDEGVLPEHASHDHLNPQLRETPVPADLRASWTKRFQQCMNRSISNGTRVMFALLDGFLLYWDKVCVKNHVTDPDCNVYSGWSKP